VRRVPVKDLKIDPLPAALDSNGGKPGHQPSSDPLSARRLGDKGTFKGSVREVLQKPLRRTVMVCG
jgi:hypothetical protein